MIKTLKSFAKVLFVLIFILLVINAYSRIFIEKNENKIIEKINYSEINNNSSSTILFVGGLSGWSSTWYRSVDSLQSNLKLESSDKKYNYIAIDLPPFGYSLPNEGNYFRDTQAKIINEFIESKNINNIIFVMHSYGAGPGMEAVMNNKEKFKKVIIIDGVLNIDEAKKVSDSIFLNKFLISNILHVVSSFDWVAVNRLKSFVHIKDNINTDLARLYSKPFEVEGNSEKLATWLIDYVKDSLNYISNESNNYKNLNIPVSIIWGDKDTLTPIELAHKLYESLDNENSNIKNNLHILDNVGHIPMIEDYKKFDEALLKAIKE